jgi:hypothetical protein
MCAFQIAESNDLERVTDIIEHLDSQKCCSSSQLIYMLSKYSLFSKIQLVLKKYCNGNYGFEHPISLNGRFQKAIIFLVVKILFHTRMQGSENDTSPCKTSNEPQINENQLMLEFLSS